LTAKEPLELNPRRPLSFGAFLAHSGPFQCFIRPSFPALFQKPAGQVVFPIYLLLFGVLFCSAVVTTRYIHLSVASQYAGNYFISIESRNPFN